MIDFAEAEKRFSEYNRTALAEKCRRNFSALPPALLEKLCSCFFWEPACIRQGTVQAYSKLPESKFNAIDFFLDPELPPAIRRIGDFAVLPVTVSRVLPFGKYAEPEAWFAALSHKNRKKLRWLRNTMPKTGCRIRSIAGKADTDIFSSLYQTQFGGNPDFLKQAVCPMMLFMINQDCGKGWILESPDGVPLAAAFGYFCNHSFFYTYLTRGDGNPEWDRYSPGYYLTWAVIQELFQREEKLEYFFMGPGEYDYKHAFLGELTQVLRCERYKLSNIFGLIRLRYRLHKERVKHGQ